MDLLLDQRRQGLGLVRAARPLAAACHALGAGSPVPELPLLIEDEATRLWAQARVVVDPTALPAGYGELYDALRPLAACGAEPGRAGPRFLTAYEALLATLPRRWRLQVEVEVSSPVALRAYARGRGHAEPAGGLAALALQELVTQSETDPRACGVTIVDSSAATLGSGAEPERARLEVDVLVQDPAVLLDYASRRYQECWFDDWEPATLGEALWEALVAANENPSPQDVGLVLGAHSVGELAEAAHGPEARP